MAGKRGRRGPPCPVCNAVMHEPEGGGAPVCSFKGSHAAILRARAKAANKAGDTQKKNREKS